MHTRVGFNQLNSNVLKSDGKSQQAESGDVLKATRASVVFVRIKEVNEDKYCKWTWLVIVGCLPLCSVNSISVS